jgi:hypothetical protein
MPKILLLKDTEGVQRTAVFQCPACECWHPFTIVQEAPGRPVWEWNQSLEAPTFSPSLLCYENGRHPRCHSFVRDGFIEFCSDCGHEMAGQKVELPEIE